jgi:hypothetical protein
MLWRRPRRFPLLAGYPGGKHHPPNKHHLPKKTPPAGIALVQIPRGVR